MQIYDTITPVIRDIFLITEAAVVELVDTPDSKSCESNLVTVQVRPAAPAVKNTYASCSIRALVIA